MSTYKGVQPIKQLASVKHFRDLKWWPKGPAGGRTCKWTVAPGYNPWPRPSNSYDVYSKPLNLRKHARLLASGILSVAIPWPENDRRLGIDTAGEKW